ncbi:MAG: hypothetical protein DMG32_11245 [Acidobacteria bacterium]|nr:MAG: hypothetical protein DMG32_11245 [Acidobacteriota bacterium]
MSAPTLPFPQSLAEKYRPRTIAEFVGLEKPKRILGRFAAQPYPSAWLFVGPSGVGKTSMAQALCIQIRGELHHIPSQKCTVEAIEKACHDCHYLPFAPGGFHVVLCDEADRMTPAAQLALLSKLDATAFPPNTVFIFTCNSTDGLARPSAACERLAEQRPRCTDETRSRATGRLRPLCVYC